MKLLILTFFSFIINNEIKAQNLEIYKKYNIIDFLKYKTNDNQYNYIKTINRNIDVDIHYKEDKLDESYKVLLINNVEKNEIEIIPVNVSDNIREKIIKAFEIANKKFLKKDTEKYLTELEITFDYEPHKKEWNWKSEFPEIRLFLYKIVIKKTVMNCRPIQ